jgi:hypothetical protein
LARRDHRPETPPVLTPCHPGPARRRRLRPQRPIRSPSPRHRTTLRPGVATTT